MRSASTRSLRVVRPWRRKAALVAVLVCVIVCVGLIVYRETDVKDGEAELEGVSSPAVNRTLPEPADTGVSSRNLNVEHSPRERVPVGSSGPKSSGSEATANATVKVVLDNGVGERVPWSNDCPIQVFVAFERDEGRASDCRPFDSHGAALFSCKVGAVVTISVPVFEVSKRLIVKSSGQTVTIKVPVLRTIVVRARNQAGVPLDCFTVWCEGGGRLVRVSQASSSQGVSVTVARSASIAVMCPGYTSSAAIEVVRVGASNELLVKLDPGGGSLRGLVVDEKGGPIGGAVVELWRRSSSSARRRYITTISGAMGRFEVESLAMGAWVVRVHGGRELSGIYGVESDGRSTVSRRFTVGRVREISGKVLDGGRRPVAGAVVSAVWGREILMTSASSADGSFSLRVVHGGAIHVYASLKDQISEPIVLPYSGGAEGSVVLFLNK